MHDNILNLMLTMIDQSQHKKVVGQWLCITLFIGLHLDAVYKRHHTRRPNGYLLGVMALANGLDQSIVVYGGVSSLI